VFWLHFELAVTSDETQIDKNRANLVELVHQWLEEAQTKSAKRSHVLKNEAGQFEFVFFLESTATRQKGIMLAMCKCHLFVNPVPLCLCLILIRHLWGAVALSSGPPATRNKLSIDLWGKRKRLQTNTPLLKTEPFIRPRACLKKGRIASDGSVHGQVSFRLPPKIKGGNGLQKAAWE
jgi:hypothetical protein